MGHYQDPDTGSILRTSRIPDPNRIQTGSRVCYNAFESRLVDERKRQGAEQKAEMARFLEEKAQEKLRGEQVLFQPQTPNHKFDNRELTSKPENKSPKPKPETRNGAGGDARAAGA